MSLIIPNAKQSTDATNFKSLDQSEPDSLDFEILGDTGNGVLEGCKVTSTNTAFGLNVTEGRVIVKGVHYDLGQSSLNVPSVVSLTEEKQYALVVVEIDTEGKAVAKVIADSKNVGSNPTFPASVNIDPQRGVIHLDHHVVLASILLVGGASFNDTNIVDKRVMRNTTNVSIIKQGPPSPSEGNAAPGQFYFDSDNQRGDESGLYIKTRTGSGSDDALTWKELAVAKQVELPIGGVFAWPSPKAPSSDRFLPANGQTVSTDSYPSLAEAYGETGLSFSLPDLNDGYMLKGTTGKDGKPAPGSAVGSDTVNILSDNLPEHKHAVAEHNHGMGHDHGMGHNHNMSHIHDTVNHYHSIDHLHDAKHNHKAPHVHDKSHGHFSYIPGNNPDTAKGGAHNHLVAVEQGLPWTDPPKVVNEPRAEFFGQSYGHPQAANMPSATMHTHGSGTWVQKYNFISDPGHTHQAPDAVYHSGDTKGPSNESTEDALIWALSTDEKSGTALDPSNDRPPAPATADAKPSDTADSYKGMTDETTKVVTDSALASTDLNITQGTGLSVVSKARHVVWYVRVS